MDKHCILFQGDSITDCDRARYDEPNHVLGSGYPHIIASKLSYELTDKKPHFINRGISGNRVSDLYARWNEDAISLKPTLLSILIGVNDAWRMMNNDPSGVTDRFERSYRHLLEETREALPETKLVLCEPFILNVGVTSEQWEKWIAKLNQYQAIVHTLASEYNAIVVPLQKAFDDACQRSEAGYWLWDGVHPTAAGHELIAREWLNTVQNSSAAIK